jgi:hypothetical protein
LYILASPHPRLYVEVDAVAGYAPDEATLNDLRDFLTRYCNKPGGIEIVRGDVIPVETARGIPPKALARKNLHGPPEDPPAPPPAFLYVLYYDAAVCGKPVAAETGHPALRMARGQGAWQEKPRMDRLPYPAIYMNTRACGPQTIRSLVLQHEAGHALGLAGRPIYASDYHCLDKNCLMFKTLIGRIQLHRLLLGRNPLQFDQRQICRRCADQLAQDAKRAPPANLRFAGPVLVRSEADYHVLFYFTVKVRLTIHGQAVRLRIRWVSADSSPNVCFNWATTLSMSALTRLGNPFSRTSSQTCSCGLSSGA